MGGSPANCIGRREFVERCTCALAGLALSGCASLATRTVIPVDGRVEIALDQYPELLESGGSMKLLPAGETEALYVLALSDGTYSVLSSICTHLGCTVDIQDDRLVCPCHGSTFDRAGKVLQGPAEVPLSRYRSRVSSDGILSIDLRSRT
jgi:cytochrome b6-f complex iron-sulfur subunit